MAPVVDEAVRSLELPRDGVVLDAGTGADGALAALAAAVPQGRVLGIDVDARVLPLAEGEVAEHGMGDRVELRTLDVVSALADPPPGGYAAVWSSELLWPGNLGPPGAVVAAMARALAPGGVVAVLSGHYHRSVFLPGRTRLERLAHTASELAWNLPQDGPDHPERHARWLVEAGLVDVTLRSVARVIGPGPDEAGRAYLRRGVHPELLDSSRSHGSRAGMTSDDLAEIERLLAPDGADEVLDEPGHYAVLPVVLATGRAPR